jgi:hypothetical protein
LTGSVNAKPWNINGFQYPKGSVLFTAANTDPKPDMCNFGVVTDVELTFLANGPSSLTQNNGNPAPLDWNYFVDPSGSWVPCSFNTDPPVPVFSYEDHSLFFQDQIA